MIKGILTPVLLLLLVMTACRKDELTLPATISFDFEFISHEESENNTKSGPVNQEQPGRIRVDQGSLVIGSMEFEGRRDEGKDVFFAADLQSPVLVDLGTGTSNQALSFDIPQGVYNFIEVNLELGEDGQMPMIIEGKLKRGLVELPLKFHYNIPERLRIRAESGSNSSKIVLRKDYLSSATLIIDSRKIFQFVTMAMLRDASTTDINGEEVVLIDSEINNMLFNIMSERIEKSISIIID